MTQALAKRIKVGIVGGTGYTGVELLRILSQHPNAELTAITSRQEDGLPVANMFPNLRGHVKLAFSAPDKAPLRTWAQIWQDKDWAAVGQRIWAEVSGLVRVSRIEQPEAAMLSPEQSFFVRENMKLRLLNARLALLSRQIGSARNDLAVAERDLAQFFDTASRQGYAAQNLMKLVQSQIRQTDIPRLDGSLAALATASAGR